jgi:hypothetical protein
MYTHEYWTRRCLTWRKADLFDQNVPWLIKSYNTDPSQTQHWAQIQFRKGDQNAIPLPAMDEFSAAHENEAARLGKPEYRPYVRPMGESPDLEKKRGAKIAEGALRQALDDMRWPEIEDRALLHMPLYGGCFLFSQWEWSWEDTVRLPVEGAMRCPSCDFRLADAEVPPENGAALDQAEPGLLAKDIVTEDDAKRWRYMAKTCLTCDTHEEMGLHDDGAGGQLFGPMQAPGGPKLQKFAPALNELETTDYFDRPLGKDAPKGNWRIRTMDPRDVFVDNLGIGVSADTIEEYRLVHVEKLSWIRNRYENGHMVKREKPERLMEYHPVAGERAIYYGDTGTSGLKLFSQHARVKEYHRKPRRTPQCDKNGKALTKLPMIKDRGRSIVMAGNTVLYDGDFLVESRLNKGRFIPRVHLDYAPWKLRSGGAELLGISMGELIFDACENINEIHSQLQDCRQRKGSPKWLATRGMDLQYNAGRNAGGIYEWDPDPDSPNREPRDIDNTLLNSEVYKELEAMVEYIARASHLNDVETGNVPPGVVAALALQLLAEQSGESRRPRIRRIREMLERVFSHGLMLMHELCLPEDNRAYWDEIAPDQWRERAWHGLQFAGQTRVRIDAEPEHDTKLVKQQTIRDTVLQNPTMMEDPRTSRLVSQELGVPEELFDKANLQEEAAEREFIDFLEQDRDPVIDPDLDDDDAHHERHGIDFHSERWRELEEASGWDDALIWLSDWEQIFDDPAPGVDPATGQPVLGPPGLNSQMGQNWPPALELRIFEAWQQILIQAAATGQYKPQNEAAALPMAPGQPAPPPTIPEPLLRVLRLRAHDAGHRRRAAGIKQAAAAGQQIVASPGGDETAAGTVPTTGQPAEAPVGAMV